MTGEILGALDPSRPRPQVLTPSRPRSWAWLALTPRPSLRTWLAPTPSLPGPHALAPRPRSWAWLAPTPSRPGPHALAPRRPGEGEGSASAPAFHHISAPMQCDKCGASKRGQLARLPLRSPESPTHGAREGAPAPHCTGRSGKTGNPAGSAMPTPARASWGVFTPGSETRKNAPHCHSRGG